jgi:DNA-binding CsgD family transcriptional regulator
MSRAGPEEQKILSYSSAYLWLKYYPISILNATRANSFETLHLLLKETDSELPMLRFTPRGKDIFALILQGFGQRKIGERMGMSVSGVRRHREKMLLQNDCNSMSELLLKYHGQPYYKGREDV